MHLSTSGAPAAVKRRVVEQANKVNILPVHLVSDQFSLVHCTKLLPAVQFVRTIFTVSCTVSVAVKGSVSLLYRYMQWSLY
jgi:hypothetical protein